MKTVEEGEEITEITFARETNAKFALKKKKKKSKNDFERIRALISWMGGDSRRLLT